MRPHPEPSLLLTAVLATAVALAATGCVPQDDRPGPDRAERVPDGSEAAGTLAPVDAEHPTETLAAKSGLRFKVPPQWRELPADARGDDEELLAVWEANGVNYGEAAVLNGADRFDGIAEGMDAYLDDIAETHDRVPSIGRDHTPTEVQGAATALRTDYSYDYRGGTAHGVLIGLTAADGDLVLFVVAGNSVNVPKKATEAIVDTLTVER